MDAQWIPHYWGTKNFQITGQHYYFEKYHWSWSLTFRLPIVAFGRALSFAGQFTWEALEGSDKALFRLKKLLVEEWGTKTGQINTSYAEKFSMAISDDLDTPKALALLWDLVKDKNITNENKRATILYFDKILGLGLTDRATLSKEMKITKLSLDKWPEAIKLLVEEREKARRGQDFAKADQIRQELSDKGYRVEDTPNGPEIQIIREVNKTKKV